MIIKGLVVLLGALCSLCSAVVLHQHFGVDVRSALLPLIGFGGAACGLAIWSLYEVVWIRWEMPNCYVSDVAVVLLIAAIPFLPVAIEALS